MYGPLRRPTYGPYKGFNEGVFFCLLGKKKHFHAVLPKKDAGNAILNTLKKTVEAIFSMYLEYHSQPLALTLSLCTEVKPT